MPGRAEFGYARRAMKDLKSMRRIALGILALALMVTPFTARAVDAPKEKLSKAKEKYDADKDGQLSDEEKAKAKEDARAKAKATHEANLAKYDANKDGKLTHGVERHGADARIVGAPVVDRQAVDGVQRRLHGPR